MWRGYDEALTRDGLAMCAVWVDLGFADTVAAALATAGALPRWLGDPAFHQGHRSSLLRKDPAHDRPLLGDEPDDLPDVWPRHAGP